MKCFGLPVVLRILFIFPLLQLLDTVSPLRAENTRPAPPVSGDDIVVTVRPTHQPVVVDGRLDEAAWADAEPWVGRFFQQEPLDRQPSSQLTELRVIQDQANIYFGAVCYDTDPAKIFASVKRRDGNFLTDDAFELLIDTFQDKRNCYAFGTNPFGAEIDAIISDEGDHINKSWDCIWYCKATVGDSGWTIEMAIPFKSLKYRAGQTVDWGLNITREIKHTKEVTYLAPIPRGLGHNGKFKGSLFARLSGIRPPGPALNLEVQPYVSTGRTWINEPYQRDSRLDSGLDVRYHVTPRLTFDFTYKTDFAQAEADEEVLNLTRFNVNLPEKREFFLESAGLFTFGTGLQAGGSLVGVTRSEEFKLFESRTVGIRNEKKIPLLGGAKITGRAGRYSIGIMNMQSERSALDDSTTEPSSNFTAIKIRRDLLTNGYVGLMLLNRQTSADSYSRAFGSEAFFSLTPELFISGSLARTFNPNVAGGEWAGDAGAILNKDWIDVALHYTHVDSLFQPEMGFVRRGNVRSYDASLGLTKWINNDLFKSTSFVNDLELKTDHHGTQVYRENRYNFYLNFASEDALSYTIHLLHEYLPADDNIREILLERGGYSGFHQNVQFTSYRSRRFAGGIGYRWGDLYDGRSTTFSVNNETKVSKNLSVSLEYRNERLDLRHGSVHANVLASRFTYSFTTELFAKYYLQWNDADRRLSSNLLVDYIYRPRCHIYLVFNENRDRTFDTPDSLSDRLLLVKVTYLWNI
ncbi:MAG: DUF5916 domain-containing protein [Candidatus Glassbacteria bacterium]